MCYLRNSSLGDHKTSLAHTSLAEKDFRGLFKVYYLYFSFQTRAIHVQTRINRRLGKAYV